MHRYASLLVCLALAACGDATPARKSLADADPPTAAPPAPPIPGAPQLVSVLARTLPRTVGTPPASAIDRVVLAPGGAAALTLGTNGEVRLWPALDGSVEPVPVPARGVRDLSLAAAGGRLVVGIVDAAGAGRLLEREADGSWRERFATSPSPPLAALSVVPGGARAVTVGADGALTLVDADGHALAHLDERGYRPQVVVPARDGRSLVTLASEPSATSGRIDVTIERVAIADPPALVRQPDPLELTNLPALPAIAPSGGAVAWVDRAADNSPIAMAIDLASGSRRQIIRRQPNEPMRVGWASDDRLVVDGNPGDAWVSDGASGKGRPHAFPAPPVSVGVATANGYGDGFAVAAVGRWLMVRTAASDEVHYLGYELFQVGAGAVSSTGKRIAWAAGTDLYVDRTDRGDVLRVAVGIFGVQRMAFLDDTTLVTADSTRLRVIDTDTGNVVDEADSGGGAGWFDLAHDLVLVGIAPHARVYELDDQHHFGRPHIIDARLMAAGLLDATTPGAPVVWALDSEAHYNRFTRAQLRAGIVAADISAGIARQTSISGDHQGRLLRWGGNTGTLTVSALPGHGKGVTLSLPAGTLAQQAILAPRGGRVAALAQGTLLVYGPDGDIAWSRGIGANSAAMSWSADGELLLISTTGGGLVLHAADGAVADQRCGFWYGKRRALSLMAMQPAQGLLVCEP